MTSGEARKAIDQIEVGRLRALNRGRAFRGCSEQGEVIQDQTRRGGWTLSYGPQGRRASVTGMVDTVAHKHPRSYAVPLADAWSGPS